MASINWSGGSGDWSDAQDWNGGIPTENDTVQIEVPGATVTVSQSGEACYSLTTVASALDIDGGSLFTVNNATFGGNFFESSGLYMAAGTGAAFQSGLDMTGGTMEAIAGATFNVQDGGTLAGTFSGTGTLLLSGGSTYLNSGFASSISSIVVGAALGFDTNFASANYFADLNGATVDLFGHKVTLSGTSLIDGTLGDGTLVDSGTMTLGSPNATPTLENGLVLSVTGHALQAGNVTMGVTDSGAKIEVTKSGQYLINGNWSLTDGSNVGTITNAGLFAKTGGGRTASINASLSSTGTLKPETGTLLLNGLVNAISGTVTGNGTLGIGGGITTFGKKLTLSMAALNQQSGDLVLNRAISFAGEWDQNGGELNLNTTASTLTLTGSDNFDGGVITGYGGELLLKGHTQLANVIIGGPDTLTITGTLDQTGNVTFGQSSNPVANIENGATWSIKADSSINGSFGLIDNAGTFIDPNGSGTANVQPEFESSGTVTVNTSILQFSGPTLLAGTVNGSGLLDLNGNTTLQGGLAITVAELNVNSEVFIGGSLSYAGGFSQSGGGLLDLGTTTFTLSGTATLDGGALTGGGTLAAAGAATTIGSITIEGGADLAITGTAEQNASITVNGATLAIAQGGTYTLDDDYSINGSLGLLNIAGEMIAAGTGNSTINPDTNLTGTLQINDKVLTLANGGTLAGAITGVGTLNLGGSTFAVSAGLAASNAAIEVSAGAVLDIDASAGYGGYFINSGTLSLSGGDTLSLTGNTVMNQNATITGSGTVLASGNTTLSGLNLVGSNTLDLTGTVEQGPVNVLIGISSTLLVGGAGTYTLDANQSILGVGTLDVAGTLTANGDGVSILNPNIVDAGTISNNLGTLDVLGIVSGKGDFVIGAAGTLQFAQSGTITASNSVSFGASGASLILMDDAGKMPTFGAILDNFAAGNSIELYDFAANSTTISMISNTKFQLGDANGDSITFTFNTTQSLTSLSITSTADGRAILVHH